YKNLVTYGERIREIDLKGAKTLFIYGRSGYGKSTNIEALTYVLYNKPYRKINKLQLVNTVNVKNLLVEITFKAHGHQYLVRRGMKPIIVEVFVDGELLNQDAKSKDYQKVLEKQILQLNYKSFTQIVVLGSASFVPFMQLSA